MLISSWIFPYCGITSNNKQTLQLSSKTSASCLAVIRLQFDSILTSLIQFAVELPVAVVVRLVLGKKTHVFQSSLFFWRKLRWEPSAGVVTAAAWNISNLTQHSSEYLVTSPRQVWAAGPSACWSRDWWSPSVAYLLLWLTCLTCHNWKVRWLEWSLALYSRLYNYINMRIPIFKLLISRFAWTNFRVNWAKHSDRQSELRWPLLMTSNLRSPDTTHLSHWSPPCHMTKLRSPIGCP